MPYDLMAGGLEKLLEDLQAFESALLSNNDLFVEEVANQTVEMIKQNAIADDPFEMMDIVANNKIVERTYGGELAKATVINTSQNATYAEFGYGIIGKNEPYTKQNLFTPNPTDFGKWKYDYKNHGYTGWIYRNRFGMPKRSIGAKPGYTFYNSYLMVKGALPTYARRIFGNLTLGGNKK